MTKKIQSQDSREILKVQVSSLRDLLLKERSLRMTDTTEIDRSLHKATSPEFQIVFAGIFSGGKSMLINALLERELLASAEGHATGTECYIRYTSRLEEEQAVLTFLSQEEIQEQANQLCTSLEIEPIALKNEPACKKLQDQWKTKLTGTQGKLREKINALIDLLEGFKVHKDKLKQHKNDSFYQEYLSITDVANYALNGSSSAVIKRIDYYCHHPLLKDGNVLVDLPGVDAPVEHDTKLTYDKIKDEEISAVVCVLGYADRGDMTEEELELLDTIEKNQGISDRVFYVFNRVDSTWYSEERRKRLERKVSEFTDASRVFRTSALHGFYGSQIKEKGQSDKWGLNSLFKKSSESGETHTFISEFIRYCGSEKLYSTPFSPDLGNSRETQIQKYERILNEYNIPLIEQLIKDSTIEEFRNGITDYLKDKKQRELFNKLADALYSPCISLRDYYLKKRSELEKQPSDIESIKAQEFAQINNDLQEIETKFNQHIKKAIDQVVGKSCKDFEADFGKLKSKMNGKLTELLNTFSVQAIYQGARDSHPYYTTTPLLTILGEAFYYLAKELENVLVEESQKLVNKFFERLVSQIRKEEYYGKLNRLLGDDFGIVRKLEEVEKEVAKALVKQAHLECERYVRENPAIYTNGEAGIFQFSQVLQEASKSFDPKSMEEVKSAICTLLEVDFHDKVKSTTEQTFRHAVNSILNDDLLKMLGKEPKAISQQHAQARTYLGKIIEKEAKEKIRERDRDLKKIKQKITHYNEAVEAINSCLEDIIDNHKLLLKIKISEADLLDSTTDCEINTVQLDNNLTPTDLSIDPLARPNPPSQSASNNQLDKGKLVYGKVIDITDYVVYIDLEGIRNGSQYTKLDETKEALLHIKNVSDGYIESLPNVFNKDEEIKAMILEIDAEKGYIYLSTKVFEVSKGEILKKKNEVMAAAEARADRARRKLPK